MAKKAYILTFFYGTNYGSKLQATALSKYMESLGYDVCFIKTFLDFKYIFAHPSLFYTRFVNLLNRKETNAFFVTEDYEITPERQQRIDRYNETYLKYITVKSDKQWKNILKDKPVFIAGSDIIWQPALGYPEKYFLDFAYYTGCKRISYASSVGAKKLPDKYRNYYKKYLESFDAISVRENATIKLFKGIINKKITKVIDPTLLVRRNVWDDLSEKARISETIAPGDYILCYFVMKDERYWDYVKLVEEKTGKKVVVLPMHYLDEQQSYEVVTDGTPCEFIWMIKNAAFIVTDSFHASVFSFIYDKELYILRRTRQDEDEKFVDLLTRYKMSDRQVTNEKAFERKETVDYAEGKKVLEEDRKTAEDYLKQALEK